MEVQKDLSSSNPIEIKAPLSKRKRRSFPKREVIGVRVAAELFQVSVAQWILPQSSKLVDYGFDPRRRYLFFQFEYWEQI